MLFPIIDLLLTDEAFWISQMWTWKAARLKRRERELPFLQCKKIKCDKQCLALKGRKRKCLCRRYWVQGELSEVLDLFPWLWCSLTFLHDRKYNVCDSWGTVHWKYKRGRSSGLWCWASYCPWDMIIVSLLNVHTRQKNTLGHSHNNTEWWLKKRKHLHLLKKKKKKKGPAIWRNYTESHSSY